MTVEEAIRSRRSIRRYDPSAPVAEDDLMKILEAGRLAPSGINMQSWVFVVVRAPESRQRLAEEAMLLPANTQMCREAPVLLVCCARLDAADELAERLRDLADAGLVEEELIAPLARRYQSSFSRMPESDRREYMVLNLTIAATQMVLQATALGYGTCWLKGFSEKRVRRILNVPADLHVSSIIPLGRPAESPPPRNRKPLEQTVVWDHFGEERAETGAGEP
jgi:nitroreductase